MMKALVIDDERSSQITLMNMVSQFCSDVEIITAVDSVATGVNAIRQHQPDLIFLEVELPFQNGFTLFEHFKKPNFNVIFTTAFQKYAIKAFRFSAIDYLLKPIELEDLKTALTKARDKKEADSTKDKLEILKENLNNICNKLALPTTDGFYFVELKNIISCKSDNNYTYFHLVGGKKILVSRTLKTYSKLLEGHNFFRISRSYLVNLYHIEKFCRQKGPTVTMSDNTILSVSLRRKDNFLKVIGHV